MSKRVTGTIRHDDGSPFTGGVVQAFDKPSLQREIHLGEAATGRRGSYEIEYQLDSPRRPGRRQVNLFIRVFDDDGLLGQSEILFDAPEEATVDLTIPPSGKPLPEIEQLRQAQREFGNGRALDDADIDFLTRASDIPRQQWLAWRQATRLAEESDLPVMMLYGLARQDGLLELDGLLDKETAVVRQSLEQAIAANLIRDRTTSLDRWLARVESLRLAREARRRALFVKHQAVGRLLDADSEEPLAGFTVQATLLTEEPQALGYDISDGRGLFGLSYSLPPDTPEDEIARPVRLTILDPGGAEIHQAELTVTPDPSQVFDVSVPVPAPEEPPSPRIEALGLDLPATVRDALDRHNIHTLADVRQRGGLHGLDGLADAAVVETLEAHARLDVLAMDAETRQRLIDEGLTDIAAIAHEPRSRFVAKFTDGEGGEAKAYATQAAAQAHLAVANNHLAGLQVAAANGSWGLAPDGPTIQPGLEELLKPKCSCPDCGSAVSPLAYLADLMDYALNHLENEDQPIAINFLEDNFHQPFSRLPATCEAMETQVRQVRLCIKVLRRYLAANNLPQGSRLAELKAAEAQYRLDAYTTLLTELGTSYADLRLACTAEEAERQDLADRLGITVAHLDELFIPMHVRPVQLTETRLEALFGLVDTIRDPLAEGPEPLFLRWRLDYLREVVWQQQDWPDPSPEDAQPLIDPDLLSPAHFVQPQLNDPAFALWQQRKEQVEAWLVEVDEARQAADTPLAGLQTIVQQFIEAPLSDLVALAEKDEQGEDIEEDVKALQLTLKAWRTLLRVHRLAESEADILEEEWGAVYNILVQVRKKRHYAVWHEEEEDRGLLLSPDFFKLPLRSTDIIPPPQSPPLLPWRADENDLRDWEDLLQGRIEQEETVREALATAVSAVEEATLPPLRDALIKASITNERVSFARQAKFLGDILLIDTQTDGCQETTRISQAIETVQGILWASRNRLLEDEYPDLDLNDDNFDEAWQWLGSYATWRTAMFVFLYPENILHPSLRRRQTPAFRQLVQTLRQQRRFTISQAQEAAATYATYFKDVINLTPLASCQTKTRIYVNGLAKAYAYKLFVFARGGETGQIYWSAVDPEAPPAFAHSFWYKVPGLGKVVEVIGAVPFESIDGRRHIYLFIKTREKGTEKLAFARFDLEAGHWEGEATELELPDEADSFSARVHTAYSEKRAPRLVIRQPDGRIFSRTLNRDGSDWQSDPGWELWLGGALGQRFTLRALVMYEMDKFCLIVQDNNKVLSYRLFGDDDDGSWRIIGMGDFRGAIQIPDSNTVVVFIRTQESQIVYINPSSHFGPETVIENMEQLPQWLLWSCGADLESLEREVAGYGELDIYTILATKKWLHYEIILFPEGADDAIADYVRGITIQWLINKAKDADPTDPRFGVWRLVMERVIQLGIAPEGYDQLDLEVALIFLTVGERKEIAFRHRNIKELSPAIKGREGLAHILPVSGAVPGDAEERLFCYQMDNGDIYRCTFKAKALHFGTLEEHSTRLAPVALYPFIPTPDLSEEELQKRRIKMRSHFDLNKGEPASNLIYLQELHYFVPVLLALSLQQYGHYTAALDWFRIVYDYSASLNQRKIYPGLDEVTRGLDRRGNDWLTDPLNPHSIANTRPDTYTRFTVQAIIRCLLDYADAEFTRDTAESIPRARQLYLTALELLQTPELQQSYHGCYELIGTLTIEVGDPYWAEVVEEVKQELTQVTDVGVLTAVTDQIQTLFAGQEAWPDKIVQARSLIAEAVSPQPGTDGIGTLMVQRDAIRKQALTALDGDATFTRLARHAKDEARRDVLGSLSWITGLRGDVLADESVSLPFLAQKRRHNDDGQALTPVSDRAKLRDDFQRLPPNNPLAPTPTSALVQVAQTDPIASAKITAKIPWDYVPAPSFAFCIPRNPILNSLRLRAELNLYKIRTCRNIAGMERELEPYAASTDTISGLPTIGSGGQLVLPGLDVLKPTPYRYPVLIERAKQLVGLAQQVETTMLAALEKGEAERYSLLKARQDVQLARGGVRLQELRVKEANEHVKLAELQRDRAQIQVQTYTEWIDEGVLEGEKAAIIATYAAYALHTAAAGVSAAFLSASSAISSLAAAQSSLASAYSMRASIELRLMQWELQKALAEQDKRIGKQQVTVAQQHVAVVEQERAIAQMQVDHAQEVVDFLSNKFTNVELYDWMSGVLEGVYSYFLQNATAMAQLAAQQLAFERQETPPPFIQADYWEAPADFFSGEELGKTPDRRGLTGSARFLQDIHQLDQYAFDTDQRKLQLTKTISLAQMAPAEFQRFRETGVIVFATPMAMFDRDFPGHYLRLVRRVRTSVIALIPPNQGIRATLSTTGTSRVVIGGDVFQEVVVNHGPQSVALSSAQDATGLFELDTQPEMLLPFEGLGVDTTWEFRMPKAANLFDYDTIADVLITIEYTALNDFTYRQQVIQEMDDRISADRPFSFRHEFADQWYDLHHPELTDTPMTVRFETGSEDFPPNLENIRIEHVILYFARTDGANADEIKVDHLHFVPLTATDGSDPLGGGSTTVDGIISTRKGNGASWAAMQNNEPFGTWELAFSDTGVMRKRFKEGEIEDILVVITYRGRTPVWPL